MQLEDTYEGGAVGLIDLQAEPFAGRPGTLLDALCMELTYVSEMSEQYRGRVRQSGNNMGTLYD